MTHFKKNHVACFESKLQSFSFLFLQNFGGEEGEEFRFKEENFLSIISWDLNDSLIEI